MNDHAEVLPRTAADTRNGEADDHVYHEFTIPRAIKAVKIEGFGLVKTLTLHELTPDDEINASKRCGSNMTRLAYELAAQSLAKVNGKPVGYSDSSIDRVWKGLGPQLRTLVMTAYGHVHTPPDGAAEDFLASQKTSVGG